MPQICLWTKRWLVLSLVAAHLANSIPKWNYEPKHWTSTNSQKRLTIAETLKYQMRTNINQEMIIIFLNTLAGGFNHFNCIQGKFLHPLNGCWTQEIKEKYKRNVFVSYLLLSSFVYFILGLLVQGVTSTRQRGVK